MGCGFEMADEVVVPERGRSQREDEGRDDKLPCKAQPFDRRPQGNPHALRVYPRTTFQPNRRA